MNNMCELILILFFKRIHLLMLHLIFQQTFHYSWYSCAIFEYINSNGFGLRERTVGLRKYGNLCQLTYLKRQTSIYGRLNNSSSIKVSIAQCLCCSQFALQIVQRGLMTQDDYFEASTKALSLFQYGQVLISTSFFFPYSFYLFKYKILLIAYLQT